MRYNWPEVKLSELCSYRQERVAVDELTVENYISTANMLPNKGGIEPTESLPSSSTANRYYAGDVLISNIRPYFKKAWYATTDGGCSSDVLVLRAKGDVHPEFLYYLLTSDTFFSYMTATSKGTKMPRGDKQAIMNWRARKPPLPTQRAIADTLSCLDAKIALNKRINENLEEQAQAIFKSWFVDFEPFRNGESIDSDLGMIPKGWRVGKLGELGTIVGGATPRKSNKEFYEKQEIPWITPKDLSIQRTTFVSRGEVDISEKGLENSGVKLIPRGAVLFSSRAPIGYMAIAKNPLGTNQGFKSVVPLKEFGTPFIYNLLRAYLPRIQALGSGSTFKEVSGSVMRSVPVIVPDLQYVQNYNALVQPMYDLIETLESENQILAALRDTLLPKLMSGEIEVPVV